METTTTTTTVAIRIDVSHAAGLTKEQIAAAIAEAIAGYSSCPLAAIGNDELFVCGAEAV